MNTFQNKSVFTIRENRFKNVTFRKESVNGFDFNNNLKSNHIPTLKFTNFTKSNKVKKYLQLEEICTKINNNYNELDKLFEADEIDISGDIPKLTRIYKIIELVNEGKFNRKDLILKFKNIEDKEIQFYIKNDNGILKLYLIDIYHLGIEGTDIKTGRKDLNGIYRAHKEFNYNISNINIS